MPRAAGVAELQRPRDGVALHLQPYWKLPRQRCGECRGLFLGEANFIETLGASTLETAGRRQRRVRRERDGRDREPARL